MNRRIADAWVAVICAGTFACHAPVHRVEPVQPTEPCVRAGYSPDSPSCVNLLAQEGYVYFQSSPPGANVWVDGADLGTAPLWKKIPLGKHVMECKSQGDQFLPIPFEAGRDPSVLCQRQNSETQAVENETFTNEEKAGGIMILLGGLAATAGLILLPFLIF